MKVSRQKSFVVFVLLCMSMKLFYMKIQVGTVHIWILEKVRMRVPQKFFHDGLLVQLAAKLFCLETFMVYSSYLIDGAIDWQ